MGLWVFSTKARAELTYETTQVVTTNFIILTVQYAYEGEDIKFAVFHHDYGEPKPVCSIVYSVRNERSTPLSASLNLNDHTKVNLLKEGGIYQAENGFVRKVELRFKTSELKAFLQSKPRYQPTTEQFIAYLNRQNI